MNNDSAPDKAAVKAESGDKTSKPDSAPATGARGKPRPGKGSSAAVAWLIVLVLLAAIAAGGWYGWQWFSKEKADYDSTIAAQSRQLRDLESRLENLAETRVPVEDFETLREAVNGNTATIGDRMNAIDQEMDALRDAAQGGRRDLVKAEIEYLLRIAADELYLTQDVDTAMYALQAADDRLVELADPRFNPVRQLIADHLHALGAVNMPDTSGIALKLGSLMHDVSNLSLRQARHSREVEAMAESADADAGWWQRMQAGIARLFDKLVVVQRAEPPPPLLTPEENFFLYRNVELQLSAARAALLSGDIATYRQSLELAREWMNRFFDTSDASVASTLADISGLLDVNLQPEMPDITPALERFRKLSGNPLRAGSNTGARSE